MLHNVCNVWFKTMINSWCFRPILRIQSNMCLIRRIYLCSFMLYVMCSKKPKWQSLNYLCNSPLSVHDFEYSALYIVYNIVSFTSMFWNPELVERMKSFVCCTLYLHVSVTFWYFISLKLDDLFDVVACLKNKSLQLNCHNILAYFNSH